MGKKSFPYKYKLKTFVATKPTPKERLEGILHTEKADKCIHGATRKNKVC